MIDVQQLVEKFIDKAVYSLINEKIGGIPLREIDERAIEGLLAKSGLDRSKRIEGWLRSYGVFQGVKAPARVMIADKVVEFADQISDEPKSYSDPIILQEFDRLHKLVKSITLDREVISLCSKALWACYPYCVPIYDSFACRALWVIGRLLDIHVQNNGNRNPYPQFHAVWCRLYEQCLPYIQDEKLRGYPYKVRVFDKIIWLIGQPTFEMP